MGSKFSCWSNAPKGTVLNAADPDQYPIVRQKMHALLCILVLVAVAANAQTWSPWVDTVNPECSATCGMCGVKVVATRKCDVLGKCSGPAQRYEECGSKLCPFKPGKPGKTCCSGYVKGNLPNRQGFECVARKEVMDPKKNLS